MGSTKFPVLDPDFLLKMLGASVNDEQRGLVSILYLTGMHISCLASPKKGQKPRERPRLVREGSRTYIEWRRPKTNLTMRALVAKEQVPTIEHFLSLRPKSQTHYNNLIEAIGERAGYQDLSSMSFRHTRCIRALRPREEGGEGYTLYEVPHLMGCTPQIVARNYTKMREDQLMREGESDD